MKNLVYLLFGIIIGLLLTDRSRATPPPAPVTPSRKSRTLEELAPVIKTRPLDLTDFASDEAYVDHLKTFIDQLIQDGMTEKEAYIAAEELKSHLWQLVQFNHQLDIRREHDRYQRTEKWVEDVEENTLEGDEEEKSDV